MYNLIPGVQRSFLYNRALCSGWIPYPQTIHRNAIHVSPIGHKRIGYSSTRAHLNVMAIEKWRVWKRTRHQVEIRVMSDRYVIGTTLPDHKLTTRCTGIWGSCPRVHYI